MLPCVHGLLQRISTGEFDKCVCYSLNRALKQTLTLGVERWFSCWDCHLIWGLRCVCVFFPKYVNTHVSKTMFLEDDCELSQRWWTSDIMKLFSLAAEPERKSTKKERMHTCSPWIMQIFKTTFPSEKHKFMNSISFQNVWTDFHLDE